MKEASVIRSSWNHFPSTASRELHMPFLVSQDGGWRRVKKVLHELFFSSSSTHGILSLLDAGTCSSFLPSPSPTRRARGTRKKALILLHSHSFFRWHHWRRRNQSGGREMRFSRTIKLNEVKFIRKDWGGGENSRGESEICFSDEYTFAALSLFSSPSLLAPSLSLWMLVPRVELQWHKKSCWHFKHCEGRSSVITFRSNRQCRQCLLRLRLEECEK